ncbi:MAG TPA: hypothetical protein VJV05_17095 [Pyrinomonadaceae bacterium]|nr:hypothetical protein [Pyrinomonadaceae bacterium]
MFCPKCGSTQSDELKFCKSCGANLQALQRVLATGESDDKFDWSKTWVAEMFMSGEEALKRQAAMDRLRGNTPEVMRQREIKGGIITASIGIGLMVFLFIFMGGVIASGRVSDAAAEILSRLWIAGIIPLLVGAALVFNGLFVTKRENSLEGGESEDTGKELNTAAPSFLPPADTNELDPGTPFSVTDRTTRHLKTPRQ